MLLEVGDNMANPPKHGVINVSTLPIKRAKQYLAAMTASMNEVKDYGCHGDIGQSSQGGFTGSGMSGGAFWTKTEIPAYDRWRASAASPPGVSLATGRRGGNESGPILGRLSTVPITGASSIPSA
jgi:hypothetical protein